MREFLNRKYQGIGQAKFHKIGPLVCFFSDAIVLYYIATIQLKTIVTAKLVRGVISFQNPMIARNMTLSDFQEVALLMQNQMNFMLTIFLIAHTIIWFLAAREKPWPVKYLKGYATVAVFLTIAEVALVFSKTFSVSFYTLASFFGYLFVSYGYRFFEPKTEAQ